MQKRTNPLALKTDVPSRPLTRRANPFDEPPKSAEEEMVNRPTLDVVPEPTPNVVSDPTPEVKAAEPTFEPETAVESAPVEETAPAAESNPYGWHFVAPRAAEPVEPPAATVEVADVESVEENILPEQEETVTEEQPTVSIPTDDMPAAQQARDDAATEDPDPVSYGVEDEVAEDEGEQSDACVADEQSVPGLEDYALAARFALCGRIGRKTKAVKISSDVGRLAQLMHPDESLSTIVENALLTRIYLENRDAFDALAEMIEKKGGHIKC